MNSQCVADIEGAWIEPEFDSSLIQRCRENWNSPVTEVTNNVLATFIRQKLALSLVIPEAKRRISEKYTDDTELFDGELVKIVSESI